VILVDSSVWIDHLRDTLTGPVSHLRSLISGEELLVGDLILCEVLQGLRTRRKRGWWKMRCASLKSYRLLRQNWP
jgi:predicted nucleic acid-binding protein